MHRLNHAEISLPVGTMTDEWLADLKAFYGDIFGWRITRMNMVGHYPGPTDSTQLPRMIHVRLEEAAENNLLLSESPTPMHVTGHEHLGIVTEIREEVARLLAACQRFAAKDDRALITLPMVENQDVAALPIGFEDGWISPYLKNGFQVKYLLPFSWDIAYDAFKPGQAPPKRWQYV